MAIDYAALEEQYPEHISKDQLCRICRISKRKAKWLLEYGYIPCIDTGKKTHRFQIRLEDVIQYLKDIDCNRQRPLPKGSFSSRSKPLPPIRLERESAPETYREFIEKQWSFHPDALTPADVCIITGYSRRTIGIWITKNKLRSITTPSGILIAKEWLTDFIETYPVYSGQNLSDEHRWLIDKFNKGCRRK